MTTTQIPTQAPAFSAFTSPDIRPSGPAGLRTPPVDEQVQELDIRQVQEELAAALRHIEDLPRRHPYEASEPTTEAL